MLALALANTVNLCMSNHFYSFGGKLQRQTEGGAIGSSLTGEVARDVMSLWDRIFLKTLKNLGIIVDLYKRYVDDQLEILPPVNPGWFYCTKTRGMKYC